MGSTINKNQQESTGITPEIKPDLILGSPLVNFLRDRHPIMHYIAVDKRHKEQNVLSHMHHDLYQLSWYYQGDGDFTILGRTFKIERNLIFVTNPGELHQIVPHGTHSLECITCRFAMPDYPEKLLTPAVRLDSQFIPEVEMLLKKTLSETVIGSERNMIKASFLFSELLLLLDEQQEMGFQDSLSDIIKTAIAFMNENFKQAITIDEVATNSHVTTSHFCRTFKKEMDGVSPLSYLRQLRIGYAAERLFTSREKIADIAENSGFKNTKNLNLAFNQTYGMSPQQFRKKYFEDYRFRK